MNEGIENVKLFAVQESSPEETKTIKAFLERPEIDELFTPALSDTARGIAIGERVEKKFQDGTWITALHEGKLIGCLAVIPADISTEPKTVESATEISDGISVDDWSKKNLWELSTVVVDKGYCKEQNIKGVGRELLNKTKDWVRKKGTEVGLVTDSWIGGEMGGFVHAMNREAYRAFSEDETAEAPDTLMRIYTDPAKRGDDGPPTAVIYGILLDEMDWKFFEEKQTRIKAL